MTADEHPTKTSAPQIAAAKRTIINLAPGLAPQSGVAVGGTPCVLAAEMGPFLEIKSSAKCGRNRILDISERFRRRRPLARPPAQKAAFRLTPTLRRIPAGTKRTVVALIADVVTADYA